MGHTPLYCAQPEIDVMGAAVHRPENIVNALLPASSWLYGFGIWHRRHGVWDD